MKREYLKQLAIEAGFDVAGVQGFLVATGLEGTQDHKLRKLISLVEQATLERAAKVCDHCVAISGASLASANECHDEDAAIEISCERAAYADSAKRIRALKDCHD